jgi:hypothetical protein
MEGTKMLGRPRLVDEDSLAAAEGPVRMLFHTQAPDHLPRSVTLFASLQGFRIGVNVEMAKGVSPKPPSSEDFQKGGDDDPSKDQEHTEDQSQSDFHWKRRNLHDKEKGKEVGTSGDPKSGATKENGAAPSQVTDAPPSGQQQALHSVFKKKLMKKPGTKSSVDSSSVPPPSAKDHSASKPSSALAKFKAQPIPFNQYGSNLSSDPLLSSKPIL